MYRRARVDQSEAQHARKALSRSSGEPMPRNVSKCPAREAEPDPERDSSIVRVLDLAESLRRVGVAASGEMCPVRSGGEAYSRGYGQSCAHQSREPGSLRSDLCGSRALGVLEPDRD